jgi:WD40 repeat protein
MSILRRVTVVSGCLAILAVVSVDHARPAETTVAVDAYGDPLPPGALGRLGTTRLRHSCSALAFSPDGKTLASCGNDRLIRLWDTATGRELRTFKGHANFVMAAAFSSDGTRLVSAAQDGTIRLWDAASGKELGSRGSGKLTQRFVALVLCPDKQTAVTAELDMTVRVWDLASDPPGKEPRTLDEHRAQGGIVALSPDGKVFATRKGNSLISVWELATGKELIQFQARHKSVSHLWFTPDGKGLVTAGAEPVLDLWDAATGEHRQRLDGTGPSIQALAFAPSGRFLATKAMDRPLRIWGLASGKELRQFDLPAGGASAMTFSSDGKFLAACQGLTIHLWDMGANRELFPAAGHEGRIDQVQFSPDGRRLTTAGMDRTARVWELFPLGGQRPREGPEPLGGKQVELWSSPDGTAFRLLLTPDGRAVIASSAGKVSRGELSGTFGNSRPLITGIQGPVLCQAISPEGKLLAFRGRDRVTRLWSMELGKEVGQLEGDFQSVCLAFSPDGKLAAGSANNHPVRIWDVGTGKEIRQWEVVNKLGGGDRVTTRGANSLVFSPDSKSLLSVDVQVCLWEVVTGQERWRASRQLSGFVGAAFSPDSKLVAVGSVANPVVLLDAGTGAELAVFEGHRGMPRSLNFSPDGILLATAGEDASILLWDASEARKKTRPAPIALKAAQLAALWKELAAPEASRAARALRSLAGAPGEAVPFLQARMLGGTKEEIERFAPLIRKLDDDQFEVRDKAQKELESWEDVAAPALRKALQGNPTPEVRTRLQQLLDRLKEPDAESERLRGLRVVELLERIGTTEAQDVLKKLAAGVPEAVLTKEAAASLGRLRKR